MTIDEMIAVLEAAKRGEQIQVRGPELTTWCDVVKPYWNFNRQEYRVKPKPREWWATETDPSVLPPMLHKTLILAEARRKERDDIRIIKVREVMD